MADRRELIEKNIEEMIAAHMMPVSRAGTVAALIMQRLDAQGLLDEETDNIGCHTFRLPGLLELQGSGWLPDEIEECVVRPFPAFDAHKMVNRRRGKDFTVTNQMLSVDRDLIRAQSLVYAVDKTREKLETLK